MNILRLWIYVIVLSFIIDVSWYMSQPAIVGIARAINSTAYGNVAARNTMYLVEFGSFWWGPILQLFLLAFAFYYSSKRDVESEITP